MQLLELYAIGPNVWRGEPADYPWGHVYGGHLLAQAAVAAVNSTDANQSLAYLSMVFLRPATPSDALIYSVTCLQDGMSFSFRYVAAHQGGVLVGALLASLQEEEPGHPKQQPGMPAAGAPETLADRAQSWTPLFDRRPAPVLGHELASAWLRPNLDLLGTAPPSCTLAYLSDDLPARAAVAGTGRRREGPVVGHNWQPDDVRSLSLDHTIWFHDRFDPADWHLFTFTADVIQPSRAIARGAVFRRDGTLVASVAQTVLIRILAGGS
jgi:acyl-CoA thioesterase-2